MKICFPCWQARKAESHVERARHPAAPKKDKDRSTDALAVKKEARLDVAKALKIGARITNDNAEMVVARLLQYASDPESEHHIWALELLAQRILPRKLYEELGGQAAGVGSLQERRPSFQINILPAHPAVPEVRIVSQQDETVETLALSLAEEPSE